MAIPRKTLIPPPPCKDVSMAAEGLFLVIPWEVVESIDRAAIRLAERITNLSAPKPRPLGPFGRPALAGHTPLNFPSILTGQGSDPHLFWQAFTPNGAGLSPAVLWLIFPLRALARLRSTSRLPICRRASGEIPCAYGNARSLAVCRGPGMACYQYTTEPFRLGLKSWRWCLPEAGKNRLQTRR